MNGQIIGLHDWFATPSGRYLLAWERAQLDVAVADIFGFHAVQLGLPELDALGANRMPHRWRADQSWAPGVDFVSDFSALPFAAHSLDLLVLPHALELSVDPHATLREAARVLLPEGRMVISGLNPTSLWGLPQAGELIGYWRLRDWLRLLDFEVEIVHFGGYKPAFASQKWLHRLDWMDRLGERWCPILGAVYFLVAVKRVRGMTLLSPAWKSAARSHNAPVLVANKLTNTGLKDQKR